MTDIDLVELRKLVERATPGPWNRSLFGVQVLTGDSWNTICVLAPSGKDHRMACWEDGRGAKDDTANAALIALSPALARKLTEIADIVSGHGTPGEKLGRIAIVTGQATLSKDPSHG